MEGWKVIAHHQSKREANSSPVKGCGQVRGNTVVGKVRKVSHDEYSPIIAIFRRKPSPRVVFLAKPSASPRRG